MIKLCNITIMQVTRIIFLALILKAFELNYALILNYYRFD